MNSLAYYRALSGIPAWLAVILLFQFTWMTFFLQYIATKTKPSKYEWYGLSFVAIGTIFANLGDVHHHLHLTLVGILLGLLAAVAYSLFLFFSGRINTSSPPLYRSAIIVTVSAITITFVYPLHQSFFIHNLHGLWFFGILISLFSQAIPTLLFSIGIPKISGGAVALLTSAEFPVAVLLSVGWLGERMGWSGWLGIALIFSGIIVGQDST